MLLGSVAFRGSHSVNPGDRPSQLVLERRASAINLREQIRACLVVERGRSGLLSQGPAPDDPQPRSFECAGDDQREITRRAATPPTSATPGIHCGGDPYGQNQTMVLGCAHQIVIVVMVSCGNRRHHPQLR